MFISYRRTDDRHLVGRLRDVLANEVGGDNVFFDVDSIPVGRDFRVAIRDYFEQVDVMLVVIGPRWDTMRLARGNDLVRTEIVEAFRQATPIIPVLIDDTPMPPPEDLPDEVQALSYLNALSVRPDPDFKGDAARLCRAVRGAEAHARAEREQAQARADEEEAELELARAEVATADAARRAAESELRRLQAERIAAEQVRLAAEAEAARLRAETERDRARAEVLAAEQAALAFELEAERRRARQLQADTANRLSIARAQEDEARVGLDERREHREAVERRQGGGAPQQRLRKVPSADARARREEALSYFRQPKHGPDQQKDQVKVTEVQGAPAAPQDTPDQPLPSESSQDVGRAQRRNEALAYFRNSRAAECPPDPRAAHSENASLHAGSDQAESTLHESLGSRAEAIEEFRKQRTRKYRPPTAPSMPADEGAVGSQDEV